MDLRISSTIHDSESNFSFDIVFIPGKNGNQLITSAEPVSSFDSSEPKDHLNARVLTWVYDETVSKLARSENLVTAQSLKLLNELCLLRYETETKNVRLIFICHGFGCVICQRLLVDSRNAPDIEARAIYNLTVGLIFLESSPAPSPEFGFPQNPFRIARQSWALNQKVVSETGRLEECFLSLLRDRE